MILSGLAKLKKPIIGIEELVWNALDADAKRVEVILRRGLLDGLDGDRRLHGREGKGRFRPAAV